MENGSVNRADIEGRAAEIEREGKGESWMRGEGHGEV